MNHIAHLIYIKNQFLSRERNICFNLEKVRREMERDCILEKCRQFVSSSNQNFHHIVYIWSQCRQEKLGGNKTKNLFIFHVKKNIFVGKMFTNKFNAALTYPKRVFTELCVERWSENLCGKLFI